MRRAPKFLPKLLTWTCFGAACLSLVLADNSATTNLQFAPTALPQSGEQRSDSKTPRTDDVRFDVDFVPHDVGPPKVHSGTLAQLADGSILAAWFGGTREGARDTQIYFARLAPETRQWTTPSVIASRPQTTRDLNRYVAKLGNPVLFVDSRQRVWLFYVTVSVGGWSGSSVTMRYSDDGGATWTDASRLTTSPFLNISTLVKGTPLECDSGHVLVPAYHELLRKFGQTLTIDRAGKLTATARLTSVQGAIQPSLVPTGPHTSIAFYRPSGHSQRRVLCQRWHDVFSAQRPALEVCDLPNPDSGFSVIRRRGGGFLMACNPTESGRHRLSLAISDNGTRWTIVGDIENAPAPAEFSYPYLVQGPSDDYHLIYTWKRTKMRYAVFNEAWLEKRL